MKTPPRMVAITRLRRECELVSAHAQLTGTVLGVMVVVTWRGEPMYRQQLFPHDTTPDGLAAALEAAAQWIRSGNATSKDGE